MKIGDFVKVVNSNDRNGLEYLNLIGKIMNTRETSKGLEELEYDYEIYFNDLDFSGYFWENELELYQND